MKNIIIPALVALALAGCSTTVAVERSLDYEAGPLPADYAAQIAPSLRGTVIEKTTEPLLVHHRTGGHFGGPMIGTAGPIRTRSDWLVCYRVDGVTKAFLIGDGRVQEVSDAYGARLEYVGRAAVERAFPWTDRCAD